MNGLILIPTPISEIGDITSSDRELLAQLAGDDKNKILVEDHKVARRRWIAWGLDREVIERFELYNEHNQNEEIPKIINHLQSGGNVLLMSDGGLPAFCDPGKNLVDACHKSQLSVTSLSCSNSIALAVALSGYDHNEFYFLGFLPKKNPERAKSFKDLKSRKVSTIIMDTPYRLTKVLEELKSYIPNREIFLAMDLNRVGQKLVRGMPHHLLNKFKGEKREFVMLTKPN